MLIQFSGRLVLWPYRPLQIGAVTQKLMSYCLLMMTFQSIAISGEDKAMIQVSVDRFLRARLLLAIDTAQLLEFSIPKSLTHSRCF